MSDPDPAPLLPHYRDRRAGLMVFGVLLMAIGGVCALIAAGLVAGPSLAPGTAASAPYALAAGVVTYGLLAVLFAWLGAGSVLQRRWAPPLILTVGWLWLITGVIGLGVTVVLLPLMFDAVELQSGPMPDALRTAVALTLVGVLGVMMVIVPAVLILFYRSRHVLATCTARDPVPRWTDGRPPWLLGLSLSLLLMALSILQMMLVYDGMALCFGAVVVGAPGILVNLALAAVLGACAWSTLRLDPRGWWAAAVSVTLATASAVVTFARRDPGDIWRAAGVPADQIQAISGLGSTSMIAFSLICWLSIVGYLVYVREHFRHGGTRGGA